VENNNITELKTKKRKGKDKEKEKESEWVFIKKIENIIIFHNSNIRYFYIIPLETTIFKLVGL